VSGESILSLIIGILVGSYVYFLFKALRRNNRYKDLKRYECKETHDWIQISYKTENFVVCKKCCKIAGKNAFIKREYINSQIAVNNFKRELDISLQTKKQELADIYNVSIKTIDAITDELKKHKKDFTINHLSNIIKKHNEDKENK
jgi:hypothetical protein